MANREQRSNREKKKPKADKNKAKPAPAPHLAFGDPRNQKSAPTGKK